MGSIFQVPGPKPTNLPVRFSRKNQFFDAAVSEFSFNLLEVCSRRAHGTLSEACGMLWEFLEASKTVIPYSTSFKNQVFNVPTSKTPPGSALEGFRISQKRQPNGFWECFWMPFGYFDRVRGWKIQTLCVWLSFLVFVPSRMCL